MWFVSDTACLIEQPSDPSVVEPPAPPPIAPCVPSCGANAECQIVNGVGSCACLSGFYGQPILGCTPQCVTNSDCKPVQACINNRCIDPCEGSCGLETKCHVKNHNPICSCRDGYIGDPFRFCQPRPVEPGMHLFNFCHFNSLCSCATDNRCHTV